MVRKRLAKFHIYILIYILPNSRILVNLATINKRM